jgi:hypothetical protein
MECKSRLVAVPRHVSAAADASGYQGKAVIGAGGGRSHRGIVGLCHEYIGRTLGGFMPRGRRSRFLPTIFVMFWSLLLAAELSAQTSAPAGCLIPNWTRAVLNTPLVPDHAEPGSPAFTLTVNGTGFGNGQQVFWNSVGLVTPGGNWSQTAGTVPASLLAQAGTAAVTVQNSSLPSLPQYFYIAAAHKIGSGSWIRTDFRRDHGRSANWLQTSTTMASSI